MKGLHGGIPIAVLAAVARAQYSELIGGSKGVDTGNSAAVPSTNEFASIYNDKNKDDHSIDIDHSVDIDHQVDVDVHPRPPHHHWRPRADGSHAHGHDHDRGDATLIGGSGGVDSGNSASVPSTNQFSSLYDEDNKDDHSVDIDHDVDVNHDIDVDVHAKPPHHPRPPHHHPRPRAHGSHAHGHDHDRGDATLIGGSGGVDSGNSASVPSTNQFSSLYDEDNKDDHSVDIDHDVDVNHDIDVDVHAKPPHHHPRPPHHHPRPRAHDSHAHGHDHDRGDATLIGGSGGVDSGNSASVPSTNQFSSLYDEDNKDDHSVDIDHDVDVNHDIDVDVHAKPPHHHPRPPHHHPRPRAHGSHAHGHDHDRGDATLIGGSGGVDSGNSASVPSTNQFSSLYNEDNKDDHSVDIDDKFDLDHNVDVDVYGRPPHHHPRPAHHHWKPRADGGHGHHHDYSDATIIGGPKGADSGNSASVPSTNQFASLYDEDNKDDHSVDIDDKFDLDHNVDVDVYGRPPHHHPRPAQDHPRPPHHHWTPRADATHGHGHDHHHGDHGHGGHGGNGHVDHDYGDATLIGGTKGVDSGNSASVPSTNQFASLYDEKNKDDHSVDIDDQFDLTHNVDVDVHARPPHHHPRPAHHHPRPPHHHWTPRADGGHGHHHDYSDATLIGGPSGVDIGNSAAVPSTNEFASIYDEQNKDDHSTHMKEDVDVDVDVHKGSKGHMKTRRHGHDSVVGGRSHAARDDHDVTMVDGPSGVDIGNAIGGDTENDTGLGHAGHGHDTVIGGASGVDIGSSVEIPKTNTFASAYTEKNVDDHSKHIDDSKNIDDTYHKSYYKKTRGLEHGDDHGDATVIGGASGVDIGNVADVSSTNSFASRHDENNKDDHSFTGKGQEHYSIEARGGRGSDTVVGGGPSGADSGNGASAPFSSGFGTAYSEQNEDDHSISETSKADTVVGAYAPTGHHHAPQEVYESQPMGNHNPAPAPVHQNNVAESSSPMGMPPIHGSTSEAGSHSPGINIPAAHGNEAGTHKPSGNKPAAHGGELKPSPAVAHAPESQVISSPVAHGTGMEAAPSTIHMAVTSTITVPRASSFAKIPVHVPASSAAYASGAAHSANAAVSSSVYVHGYPSSAVHSAIDSNMPSPSTAPSAVDGLFKGGVARVSPNAGVLSICGVLALLAYVL
ncbi:hypothetical protein EYZ11_006433 [Aspergillus tanneri]|uniref:Uncharacterized protein n=1 Tax=Aspergillus tanneri TaxID=1220188 RepID=A0A4V3UP85_9EURO|nr:hypothetical protein EYZ11_006433 [Aspergillus tanneri]